MFFIVYFTHKKTSTPNPYHLPVSPPFDVLAGISYHPPQITDPFFICQNLQVNFFLSMRLLKNAHLRRFHHPSSLRRTSKYASLLGISEALHLGIFEQPMKIDFSATR